MADDAGARALGPNEWLVDEMYEQYLADPTSVSESWREFFADYRRDAPATPEPQAEQTPEAPRPEPASPTPAKPKEPEQQEAAPAAEAVEPEPLRGAAARIVANMEASLDVPTATSFREVPAKLLEVNRTVINGYLGRTFRGKVSFTHLIGFAVVRALQAVPAKSSGLSLLLRTFLMRSS